MGGAESKLARALPAHERYFGLENYENTCYCNSVLQALYFCLPFREHVLDFHKKRKCSVEGVSSSSNENRDRGSELLNRLADLFSSISTNKKQTGVIGPREFVRQVRRENEMFQGDEHQDAHEFLNFVLNQIMASLQRAAAPSPNTPLNELDKIETWVHELFQGRLTNITKCLACENVTSVSEPFLDLSVDVEHHSSLTRCLTRFSSVEQLGGNDKFFCDNCCGLQEAQKRMLVDKLPAVLTVHLKRFKFSEQYQQFRKLSSHVVFPFELRVGNTSEKCEDRDRLYHLFAVVIHSGSGMNRGHYVSVVKSHGHWLLFDDEDVQSIEARQVQSFCFGSSGRGRDVAYLLFYTSLPEPPQQLEDSDQESSITSRSEVSLQSTTSRLLGRLRAKAIRH